MVNVVVSDLAQIGEIRASRLAKCRTRIRRGEGLSTLREIGRQQWGNTWLSVADNGAEEEAVPFVAVEDHGVGKSAPPAVQQLLESTGNRTSLEMVDLLIVLPPLVHVANIFEQFTLFFEGG